MYFEFDKNLIFKDFPIFSSDVNVIFHFFSLDLIKETDFDNALFSTYPESFEILFQNMFEDKIEKGSVLAFRKSNPSILFLPYKKTYSDEIDKELLDASFDKISSIFKDMDYYKNVKKIGVQVENNKIEESVLIDYFNNMSLPEIEFFKMEKKNNEV